MFMQPKRSQIKKQGRLLGAALTVFCTIIASNHLFHARHVFVAGMHPSCPTSARYDARSALCRDYLCTQDGHRGSGNGRTQRHCGDVPSPTPSVALATLEKELEAELVEAEARGDNAKVTKIARLMVLAKASEGAAAWQSSQQLKDVVGNTLATTLREFVGKDNYNMDDVASAVNNKVAKAVAVLEGVYIDHEAAKTAKPGTELVVLSDVVGPVVGNIQESGKDAVLAFTGKEKYAFGDITKEANRRAADAVAKALGNKEYKFGDISRAAAAKAMEGITGITGKKDYQFGDLTKTFLKGALNMLEQ